MLSRVSSLTFTMNPVSDAPSRVNITRFHILLAAHRTIPQLRMVDFLGGPEKRGDGSTCRRPDPCQDSGHPRDVVHQKYTVLNCLVAWLPGYPTALSELGRSSPIKPSGDQLCAYRARQFFPESLVYQTCTHRRGDSTQPSGQSADLDEN